MKENKKKLTDNTKRRYKSLMLVDAIFVILYLAVSILLSIFSGSDYGPLELVLCVIALAFLFMIIHGIASFVKYRSIVFPNLIITGLSLSLLFITYLINLIASCFYIDAFEVALGSSIYFCFFILASVISSIITMLIMKLCGLINNPKVKYLYLFFIDIGVWFLVYTLVTIGKNFVVYYPFTYADIILVCAPIIVCILRGILSRVFLKRTLAPFLMLFFELWIGLLIACVIYMSIHDYFSSLLYSFLIITICAVLLSVISALFSLITFGIMRLFKAKKSTAVTN